jgi:hypothetical protein
MTSSQRPLIFSTKISIPVGSLIFELSLKKRKKRNFVGKTKILARHISLS